MDSPCIKQTVCKVLKIFQHGNYLVAHVLKYIMNLQIYELIFFMFLFSEKEKTHLHFAGWNFAIIIRKYNLILYKYISFRDNMKNK